MSKASKILYNLVNHTFDPALRTKVWQWLVHPSNQKEKEEALLSIWNEYPTGANAETYRSLNATKRKINQDKFSQKRYSRRHFNHSSIIHCRIISVYPVQYIRSRTDTMFRSGRRKTGTDTSGRFESKYQFRKSSYLSERVQGENPYTFPDRRSEFHRQER